MDWQDRLIDALNKNTHPYDAINAAEAEGADREEAIALVNLGRWEADRDPYVERARVVECIGSIVDRVYYAVELLGGKTRWSQPEVWRPPASCYETPEKQREVAEEIVRALNS